jgi:hypothetical protein
MLSIITGAIIIGFQLTTANAQDVWSAPPAYDIGFQCSVAAHSQLDPSQRGKDPHDLPWSDQLKLVSTYDKCVKLENEAYSWIKENWPKISGEKKLACQFGIENNVAGLYEIIAVECGKD